MRVLIFLSLLTLTACSGGPSVRVMDPLVPEARLQPTPLPDYNAKTYRDLAVLLVRTYEAGQACNIDKKAVLEALQ